MICPFKFGKNTTFDGTLLIPYCQCEEEECAWWSKQYKACWIAVESYEERARLSCQMALKQKRKSDDHT